jgi:alkylation response protein AidB-like acyl-CoA dehydrogenase
MPIGLSDEHEALRATVRRWLESRCPPSVPRAYLEAGSDSLPGFWGELAGQGWLGLHVPEVLGGQGYGLPELAVVLEETGRAAAPGPFLPTVLVSAALCEARAAEATGAGGGLDELVRALASGSLAGGVALGLGGGALDGRPSGGDLVVSGSVRPVLGAQVAGVFVVPVRLRAPDGKSGPAGPGGGVAEWCVLEAAQVSVAPLQSLDPTRPLGELSAEEAVVPPARRLAGLRPDRVGVLAATLAAAEAVGGLGWCLDTASSYAKVREQFGRPIGQFQAVKHRLADMLVALEQATAAAWDASNAAGGPGDEAELAAAIAASLALDGFAEGAKACVQLLGGVGFTWEHDAHIYLKRAIALRQLLGGAPRFRAIVASQAVAGVRRSLAGELRSALPREEAERCRDAVRPDVEELSSLSGAGRRQRMADLGYVAPHWPAPWGRDASPVEQLVIDEEMSRAGIHRPNLAVGAWALPTIIAYGTPEQQERWVRPTLYGDITWCQMFSEPGAGSDLASLSTKAVRVEGGWRLSGQKVWTSLAREADFAICLARTNPSAPKHSGITYFIVDMRSEGLDIRPLRELTGAAMFNEIFISDVFVPDENVIGEIDDGWRIARTTLANERVSMSSGSSFGGGVEGVIQLVSAGGGPRDVLEADRLGGLVAEAQSLALLAHRATLRAVSGTDPGAESSVRKLLGVEHEQRVQELGLVLLGEEGSTTEGEAARWTFGFLANRCLTIAGGTSEVQRNLIAERLLGLPRDPEPGG